MVASIPVPLFLQRGKARQLNEMLIEKSGCFAFLKTEHILLAEKPASYCDAFTIYAVGLYVLYHDYGCHFLRQLLSEARHHPLELDVRGVSTLEMHLKVVQNTIRPNVAHGVYRIGQREEIQNQIEKYYLRDIGRKRSTSWDDFTASLTESDWKAITRCLVGDADKLYNFLGKWANAWEKQPIKEKSALRTRFGNSRDFASSFDGRICSDVLKDSGESCNSLDKKKLTRWGTAVAQAFVNSEVITPKDVYTKLQSVISADTTSTTPTSSALADKYGFGIPTLS